MGEADSIVRDPRTTIGGIVALAIVAMLWLKIVTATEALSVLALAGGWIGISAKDGPK